LDKLSVRNYYEGMTERRRPRRMNRRHFGPEFNEGARQLWLAMARKKKDQQRLADELGLNAPALHKWLYGDCKPRVPAALVLQRKLRIPLTAWSQEPLEVFALPGTNEHRAA
jgi:hypothetical protein